MQKKIKLEIETEIETENFPLKISINNDRIIVEDIDGDNLMKIDHENFQKIQEIYKTYISAKILIDEVPHV